MKKLVFVLFAMLAMVACTGNQTSNGAVNDSDTVMVDSMDSDSVVCGITTAYADSLQK